MNMSLWEVLAQALTLLFPPNLERCSGFISAHLVFTLLSIYLLVRMIRAENQLEAQALKGCLVCSKNRAKSLSYSVNEGCTAV